MVSNRLAFAALGIACVAAAAGGGYVATRHNATGRLMPPVSASADGGSTAAVSPAALPAAGVQPSVDVPRAQVAESGKPSRQKPSAGDRPAVVARPVIRPAAPASSAALPAQIPEHASSTQTIPGAALALEPAPMVAHEERPVETAAVPEPPKPTFEELTVTADSVIGLQTETALSSERARVEDKVEARVVRDVRVAGRVAIPAGSRVLGSVVAVDRGGRARSRARLGIRFHTLALSDGTRLPISTDTIYRYGDDPSNGAAARIGGGAVAGAILGAIIGGGKGAAIGAGAGAAGGGATVMAGERSEALFPSGAQVTARIISPVTITVDR